MIKLPEKNFDPPRFRGRRSHLRLYLLLLSLLALGLVVVALALWGGGEPTPAAETQPGTEESAPLFVPPQITDRKSVV